MTLGNWHCAHADLSAQGSALVTMALHEAVLGQPGMFVQDWGGSTSALDKVAASFISGFPDDPRPVRFSPFLLCPYSRSPETPS